VTLAARPSRFRSRGRVFTYLILVCVSAVLINAIITGVRKPPSRPSATLDFVDQVRPYINESNAEASELQAIRAGFARADGASAPDESPQALQKRLKKLDSDTRATKNNAIAIEPTKTVKDTASLVFSSFTLRSNAVTSINQSLQAVLKGNKTEGIDDLTNVNQQLAVSDSVYAQFQTELNSEHINANVPDSVWLKDASAWKSDDAKFLTATWKSNLSTAKVHDVAILSVITDPSAVRQGAGPGSQPVKVLPSQKNMNVSVVVANQGNVKETKVPIKATITAADGSSDGKNDTVTLKPGGEQTIVFRNIRVVPDGVSTLLVQFGPVPNESSSGNNSVTILFTMNPTAATTTIVTILTTTTVLGH
jgi:hypothetical protein